MKGFTLFLPLILCQLSVLANIEAQPINKQAMRLLQFEPGKFDSKKLEEFLANIEDQPAPQYPASINQEDIFKSLAKSIGVKYDSDLMRKIERQVLDPAHQKSKKYRYPTKVIKHLRAKNGIALPDPNKEVFDTAKAAQKILSKIREKPLKPKEIPEASKLVNASITPQPLPACKQHLTKVAKDVRALQKKKRLPDYDVLFVKESVFESNKNLIGSEYAELFGVNTNVHGYSTRQGDLISMQAGKFGAACLPFRMRIVDRVIYYHMGADALKNYDSNPNGKGLVHPVVADQAERFF